MHTFCKGMAAATVALTLAATAHAGTFVFDWNQGDNGTNNSAGTFKSIQATYNTSTDMLTWSATFGRVSAGITDGFTLALNNGPNPKGHAGELALLYFDGSSTSAPVLSVYAYNGRNASDSWRDGDGNLSGNQTPDFIGSSKTNVSWISNLSVVDNGNMRTFSFDMDASVVRAHTPAYPGSSDWYGIGFGDGDPAGMLGIWLHSYIGYAAQYDALGRLTSFSSRTQGWFDGSNIPVTTTIPLPGAGAMGIAGLLGIAGARRRRRAA
ncbi:MAG: hypothetical protein ACR2GY_02590 [Phycisphaerales bacterium]